MRFSPKENEHFRLETNKNPPRKQMPTLLFKQQIPLIPPSLHIITIIRVHQMHRQTTDPLLHQSLTQKTASQSHNNSKLRIIKQCTSVDCTLLLLVPSSSICTPRSQDALNFYCTGKERVWLHSTQLHQPAWSALVCFIRFTTSTGTSQPTSHSVEFASSIWFWFIGIKLIFDLSLNYYYYYYCPSATWLKWCAVFFSFFFALRFRYASQSGDYVFRSLFFFLVFSRA